MNSPRRPHQPATVTAPGRSSPKQAPSALAIWANLMTVYIVWGSTYLAIRFAVETLPPFLMAAARQSLAGAVLYAWRRARGDAAPSRQEWRSAAIIGVFLLVGGNGVVSWAAQRIPSGLVALLLGTIPLWMVVLDVLRPGGGWPAPRAIIGVLLGFAGVAVLVGPNQITGSAAGVDLLGVAAVLLASLSWAAGSLYGRRAVLPPSPLLGASMQMIAGAAILVIVAVMTGEPERLDLAAVSLRSLGGFAYLIVFGSWAGYAAYLWLLRAAPTPLVSTYAYVNPLVAIFLGHLLAAEPLTPSLLIAAAIILGSVALITTAGPVTPRSQPAQPRPVAPERES